MSDPTNDKKPVYIPDSTKVRSSGPIGRQVTVSVGGVILPCYRIVIEAQPDSYTRMTIETRADHVDIEALQNQTTVVVKDERSE